MSIPTLFAGGSQSSGGAPSTPENACNACEVSIPDTLYVENDALTDDLAQFNDKRECTWSFGCVWQSSGSYPRKNVTWLAAWHTYVYKGANCYKEWLGGVDTCDPTDAYAEENCDDSICTEGDTCENSAGATSVVTVA